MVFLYPDLATCVVGTFCRGLMKQGTAGILSGNMEPKQSGTNCDTLPPPAGVYREMGVAVPSVEAWPRPRLCHAPATATSISAHPLVRDTYEER